MAKELLGNGVYIYEMNQVILQKINYLNSSKDELIGIVDRFYLTIPSSKAKRALMISQLTGR